MLLKKTTHHKNTYLFLIFFISLSSQHINAMNIQTLIEVVKSGYNSIYECADYLFSLENITTENIPLLVVQKPNSTKKVQELKSIPQKIVKKKLVINDDKAQSFINKLNEKKNSLELFNKWAQTCKKLPYNRDFYSNNYSNVPEEFDYKVLAISAAAHLLMLKNNSNLINPKSWVNNNILKDDFFSQENNVFMPFIQKLIVPPYSEIAYHGDLHGDLHSLIAYLEDLQSKNYLSGFTIKKDGFYMVFLGDYVDRGNYGAEVIYTLLNLKIANPDKVYLVRGNHEDYQINAIDGFKEELSQKFPGYNYNYIYNLYNTLPVALFVGSGRKENVSFLQCCHGGMEIGFFPNEIFFKDSTIEFEKINSLERTSNMEALCLESSLGNYYKDENNEIAGAMLKKILKDKEEITTIDLGFLWSDFILPRKFKTRHKGSLLNFNRSRGFEYSKTLTKKILKVISQRIAPHKLVGVFRAHQHDYDINGMMGLILDKDGVDPNSKGVAKIWRKDTLSKNTLEDNLWPGIVCTFNVSPDTSYGFDKQAGFNFESYGLLKTGENFPNDWHLDMQRIEMKFNA